jgi:hypothetical protein
LGVAVEATSSPRVLIKMVYAGVESRSFSEGSRHLENLSGLSISDERIRRATYQIADERISQQEKLIAAYRNKPLPEQRSQKPADIQLPDIAVVMCDGGRYQLLDRQIATSDCEPASSTDAQRRGRHWHESRVAMLATMKGEHHTSDPQPKLPNCLEFYAIGETLKEMSNVGAKPGAKGITDQIVAPTSSGTSQPAHQQLKESLVGPKLVSRNVIASGQNWETFGPMVATRAWYLGFATANHKVFISDGSSTIESLQENHLSHYTSILDLLHGLGYCMHVARAVNSKESDTALSYNHWASLIWEGKVDLVIKELDDLQEAHGDPPPNCKAEDVREVIRVARVYYTNHRHRMNYPEYRRLGYPLTSSLMESTVKQINYRVKGTEKYWSTAGGEKILRLRSDYLSDDQPIKKMWKSLPSEATGFRNYRHHATAIAG